MGTRVCPFCKEVIQFEAIKCKHCGSMLDKCCSEPSGDKQLGPKHLGNILKIIGWLIFGVSGLILILGVIGVFGGTISYDESEITLRVLAGIAASGYVLAKYSSKITEYKQLKNENR